MNKLQKTDFEEKLITEVSVYPCLYNKTDSEYSNRNKRNQIWEEISHLLEYPVPQCKIKWKNLKDTFFHYVRMERNNPSGSAREKKIKWLHYDALQFLLPCLDAPSTISNYVGNTEEESSNHAEASEVTTITKKNNNKRKETNVEAVLLQAIQSFDEKQPEPEPSSESKLFLDSLVPRFERLSQWKRSYMQFKIQELLHQIEFESVEDSENTC